MNGLVALPSALEGDAGGVDHGLTAGDGGRDRSGNAQIGSQNGDLADIACGLDPLRELDAPAGHADLIALLRQRPHDGAADEAAAAKDRDLLDAHGCCL
jgi:hypothetical protein